MKNVFLFAWTLLMVQFSFATNPTTTPDTGCRKFTFQNNNELSQADKFRLDLQNGTWVQRGQDSKTAVYQFHDYGLVDVLTSGADQSADFKSLYWTVEVFENQAFLLLSGGAGISSQLFKLEQTCTGMNLSNSATAETTDLTFQPFANAKILDKIRFSLSGKWTSITYPFDLTDNLEKCGTFESIKGAFLEYEFKENGTYSKKMGAEHLQIEEQGYWEVSADGKYLIMHGVGYTNPEQIYATTVAELSYVNPGELVLTQALHVSGDFETIFCTEIKSFYFHKS